MLTDRVETELELLERHIIILDDVIKKGPIGIMKLSEETGIPNHRVRYSLRVLEQERLIAPSTLGAVATDEAVELMNGFESVVKRLRDKIDRLNVKA